MTFIKKLPLMALVALVGLLVSCSSNSGVKDLLKSVPADAGWVVALNRDKTTGGSDSGAEADATRTVLANMIQSSGVYDFKAEVLKGVDMSAGVAFGIDNGQGYQSMVYCLKVADKDALVASLNGAGINMSANGDAMTSADTKVVVLKDFVWLSGQSLNVPQLETWLSQDEKKSFLSSPAADFLLDDDHDANFVGDYGKLMSGMTTMREVAQMTMAMNAAFKSPKYLAGNVDLEKGKVEASMKVLDDKGKPAATSMPMATIDLGELNHLKGKADVFFALALDPKAVGKLLEMYGPMLQLPSSAKDALKGWTGQIAGAINAGNSNFGNDMMITTSFKSESDAVAVSGLLSAFSSRLPMNAAGGRLNIGTGLPAGQTPAFVAEAFKDASFAFALDFTSPQFSGQKDLEGLKFMTLKAVPEGKSVEVDVDVEFADANQPAIVVIASKSK